MTITLREDTVYIEGERLNLAKAIELKVLLERLLEEGRHGITLSFRGLKEMSGTGYQVLSTVGRKFTRLKVVSYDSSAIDSLRQKGLL